MVHYINKDALLAEIERRLKKHKEEIGKYSPFQHNLVYDIIGKKEECSNILSFLNTLEVKEVDTWHLQEKEDIYDAVKGWGLYTFACIMKDGTIQRFNGSLDEDYEGHINVHINGVNDNYDNVDDIVKWIEIT